MDDRYEVGSGDVFTDLGLGSVQEQMGKLLRQRNEARAAWRRLLDVHVAITALADELDRDDFNTDVVMKLSAWRNAAISALTDADLAGPPREDT